MHVVMLVKNSFEYDARVTKEARSLIAAGYDVSVVAIHVPGVTAQKETRPDGIHVRRVPRVNLGVDALNRLARRYVGAVEGRHARLTGEPVDELRVMELGNLPIDTTSTPGATASWSPETSPPSDEPAGAQGNEPVRPTGLRGTWGRTSTAVLRSVAMAAQFAFRLAKAVLGRQGRALKHYAINRRFITVALELNPDVVHCHDLNTLWAGTQVKRRTGCRLVYDSHELATARNRMGAGWRLWCEFWEKRGIPHADAVVMASPGYADAARERYGIESTVIVNVPEPQTPTGTRDLRAATGLPADQTLLIYQGSIQENRGIEQVIDAVELLTGVCLVIVGYGYHRPVLERLVRERGLDDRIRFFGPVPNAELVDWSSSADIGMCNIVGTSRSYRESLPNKLFEYVMAGIPVVVSNFGSMGRICDEEGVGITCDPTDPQALADAIEKLREQSVHESRSAQTFPMASRYNWEAERQKLTELYASLDVGGV